MATCPTGIIPTCRDACVEVPVYADRWGSIRCMWVTLPPQCAAFNITIVEEMAVRLADGDLTLVFPWRMIHSAPPLSLQEIRDNQRCCGQQRIPPTFKHFIA